MLLWTNVNWIVQRFGQKIEAFLKFVTKAVSWMSIVKRRVMYFSKLLFKSNAKNSVVDKLRVSRNWSMEMPEKLKK